MCNEVHTFEDVLTGRDMHKDRAYDGIMSWEVHMPCGGTCGGDSGVRGEGGGGQTELALLMEGRNNTALKCQQISAL